MALADVVDILGGEQALAYSVRNRLDFIELCNRGVTKKTLTRIAQALSISLHQLIDLLPVSERTIQRQAADAWQKCRFQKDGILPVLFPTLKNAS